jgi:hypothetical protein
MATRRFEPGTCRTTFHCSADKATMAGIHIKLLISRALYVIVQLKLEFKTVPYMANNF